MAMTPEERAALTERKVRQMHTPEADAKRAERFRSEEYKAKKHEAHLARKNLNMLARYMLEAEIPDEDEALADLRAHGFEGNDYQAAVLWGQMKKAIYNLDTEAAKFVRDTAGYKPTENLNLGNADDKPFASIDLSKLSNDELMAMIAKREVIDKVE